MNEKKRKYANVVPTSSVVHFAGAAIVGYLRRIRDERIRELNKQKGRKKQKGIGATHRPDRIPAEMGKGGGEMIFKERLAEQKRAQQTKEPDADDPNSPPTEIDGYKIQEGEFQEITVANFPGVLAGAYDKGEQLLMARAWYFWMENGCDISLDRGWNELFAEREDLCRFLREMTEKYGDDVQQIAGTSGEVGNESE